MQEFCVNKFDQHSNLYQFKLREVSHLKITLLCSELLYEYENVRERFLSTNSAVQLCTLQFVIHTLWQ